MKATANYRLSSHRTLSPDFKDKKVIEILGKKKLKSEDCQFDFICLTKNGECLVIDFNKASMFGCYLIRQNFYYVDSLNIYNENDVFKVVPPKKFQQDLKVDTIKWICDQASKVAKQTKMLEMNDSLHNETCSRSFIQILEKHQFIKS